MTYVIVGLLVAILTQLVMLNADSEPAVKSPEQIELEQQQAEALRDQLHMWLFGDSGLLVDSGAFWSAVICIAFISCLFVLGKLSEIFKRA